MKTVIMAGGKGTRIQSVANDIPKPMIPVNGKPVLEQEIVALREQGFTEFILTVSHLGQVIMDYFGDGSALGVSIQYYYEDKPIGNAGALFKLREQLDEDFLLLNADTVFNVDFNRFLDFHKEKGGLATILTHPNSHPYDSGLVISDSNGSVKRWLTKEDERPIYYKNRVNAGVHILSPTLLDFCEINPDLIGKEVEGKTVKIDLDRQLLRPLAGTGKLFCYDSPEYVRDMGTPERLKQVIQDMESGVVAQKSLKNKQKAIFLDRDGTINVYKGFLRHAKEMELIDGVADAIRMINNSGRLTIIITNQPVIARGEVSSDELDCIHMNMETQLGSQGAYIDDLFYCPHHPDSGFEGEIRELKIQCDCRKPSPGMLFEAAEKYNIDLSESWMIGDSKSDIQAGINAGCRTAFLGTDDYGQSISANSLKEVVTKILA